MRRISNPMVSVAIISKDYGQYLTKSVISVVNQTYQNIEIFVVDDCSKDNSRIIIKKLKKDYPNIKFIINKKNLGLQKIFNN